MGLPNKLSSLLDLTASCLEAVLKNDRYRFDEEVWHEPSKRKCDVSIAGTLLVVELEYDWQRSVVLDGLDEATAHCLLAVDAARCGLIRCALRYCGLKDTSAFSDCEPAPDELRSVPAWLRNLSTRLGEAGV